MLPPTVVGLLLLLLLGRQSPIGQALSLLGLRIVFTPLATALAAFVISFPLLYQSAVAAFKTVSHELIDDAKTTGLGEWQILFYVKIPLALPGLLAGTILTFVRSLGEFGATLMLAGNIPGQTQTLPVAIFFSVEAGDTTRALLYSSVLIVISSLAVYCLGRLNRSN